MLKLEMRTAERQVIAEFDLKEGEILEDRVKQEIAKARENGSIDKMPASPNIPPVAVFDGGDKASMALFTMSGNEVTNRDATISAEKNARDEMTYAVTGMDEGKPDQIIGIFFVEDRARMAASLWKSGVLA